MELFAYMNLIKWDERKGEAIKKHRETDTK